MKLETLHLLLKEYIQHEEDLHKVYPASAEYYNVPTWDNIHNALETIESIINFHETCEAPSCNHWFRGSCGIKGEKCWVGAQGLEVHSPNHHSRNPIFS